MKKFLLAAFSTLLIFFANNSFAYDPQCEKLRKDMSAFRVTRGSYYFRLGICTLPTIHDQDSFLSVVNYFTLSAEKKYPAAYFALGLLFHNKYELGKTYYGIAGNQEDLVFAIQNYIKAAELGSSSAQNNLGEIYLAYANLSYEYRKTRRIKENIYIDLPDLDKALYWLEKSAKNGNPAAQGTISDLYKQGIGVPQDYVVSYVWLNISIASQLRFNKLMKMGNIGQKISLSNASSRDKAYSLLSSQQKDQAQSLLKEYTNKYFLRPNELDSICRDIQAIISMNNISTLVNSSS